MNFNWWVYRFFVFCDIKSLQKLLLYLDFWITFVCANEIYYKELTVLGSYSPSPKDLSDSFEMITKRKVNVKNLTTVYRIEDIQQAFDDTINNKIFKAYVKI